MFFEKGTIDRREFFGFMKDLFWHFSNSNTIIYEMKTSFYLANNHLTHIKSSAGIQKKVKECSWLFWSFCIRQTRKSWLLSIRLIKNKTKRTCEKTLFERLSLEDTRIWCEGGDLSMFDYTLHIFFPDNIWCQDLLKIICNLSEILK